MRIGDRISDEFARSGHDERIEDLDALASLGIRAVRYPISWERMVTGRIDWAWATERLERLRDLGIRPIVGFVHHGGGPHPEGLLSPDFARGLGDFAREVAERFPWVDAYTPVNEPGTTARFCGLYGFWHPHRSDLPSFARALLNEIAGTRAAMRAIRAVNPLAQLVQTEDVGKSHAPPALDYQVDFENERRWLTFDLLEGRVDADHPIRPHLLKGEITADELDALCADPCPPDVFGMNHYVTSERFLDERLHLYPPDQHGGNGRHAYVDVPALRVRLEGAVGPAQLLRELWARYRKPIAITEVQLACTREEQVRWLVDAWHAAEEVRAEGADVRAVTAWATFGAQDWDSLLLEPRGNYETGAFDLRAPVPRPTAVAHALRSLATTGRFEHPVLAAPGWWRRPERLILPPVSAPRTGINTSPHHDGSDGMPPLLIVGARGMLGSALLHATRIRALNAVALTRRDGDFTQLAEARRVLALHRPWAVVNAAGYSRVDAAEAESFACRRDNTLLPAALAEACAELGIPFLTFSSDLVFDGTAGRPYVETDTPHPLSLYGRTQHEAEQRVMDLHRGALIIRTSALFGAPGPANFVSRIAQELSAGKTVFAPASGTVSPTFVPDLVDAALDLVIDGESGLWHVANGGALTWVEWARAIATLAGHPVERVQAVASAQLGWHAPRPQFSVLASARGQLLSPLPRALDRYFAMSPPPDSKIAA